jgi:DNA modification methylase
MPAPDYELLDRVDWNFADAKTRGGPHGIHPYPAKFIPQIPRTLIAALHHRDGSAVLDPFCGSGTTLVEAAVTGIPAVGVDLHPLACLISKVKITPLQRDLSSAAHEAVARASKLAPVLPAIPAIDHWFQANVQRALAALVGSIEKEEDADVRDALRVALSSIIVRVSRQDSDTRYAAVEKETDPESVDASFLHAAQSIGNALHATWSGMFVAGAVRIVNKDILAVTPADIGVPVSLVVTSPPYPNAYEYWLYHKYRMYWLGMDPVAVREKEIGARPHYFKRNPQTAGDFERQMETVFQLLQAVVVQGGHACVQVGSSIIRGEPIDNAAMLERVAARTGFILARSFVREIPRNRKAFNLSHARINSEHLLIFRREDT